VDSGGDAPRRESTRDRAAAFEGVGETALARAPLYKYFRNKSTQNMCMFTPSGSSVAIGHAATAYGLYSSSLVAATPPRAPPPA
jgi:hypothetical protein